MSLFLHMSAPQGFYCFKTALTIQPIASGSADIVLFLAVYNSHMARLATAPLLALLALTCSESARTDKDTAPVALTSASTGDSAMSVHTSSLQLTSTAFKQGGAIPARYTCEGDDSSPPLAWAGAPAGTKSFALVVDDPDAPDPAKPQRVWVHWVVYNLPVNVTGLAENASRQGLPKGAALGKNDFGKSVYGGPCPPIGRHRYFFKLYALDTELTGLSSPNKADLTRAIQGHVLANAELMGTYQKSK
jgi:Raf kinase inhibitor-like YbhB/YbcL family protein